MKFRFTKTALQGLAAPDAGKRLSVYDTEQTKLALRVTSAGTKTFYVIKRVGASMVWLKLGVFPDMTVEQARNEAARALGEFASGANPAAVKRAFKAEPTLSEAFKDFTDHKRKRDGSPIGEKTKRDYADIFRLYLNRPGFQGGWLV